MFVAETIKVSQTPTSLKVLLETARGREFRSGGQGTVRSVTFRATAAKIYVSDSGTATPPPLIDPTEEQYFADIPVENLAGVMLHSDANDVSVYVIGV